MSEIRHDWAKEEVQALFDMPFADLIFKAQTTHRRYFNPNAVQICHLLSIKTGGCPEDCGYCSQSAHYDTGLKREKLLSLETVIERAKEAKAKGASRFCMGAAWRNPRDKDLDKVIEMIQAVKAMGLETCVTLGMLTEVQAQLLKESGLDYYNHNLDSSPDYYKTVTTTRTYQDRLETLSHVRKSGIHVCCGGIIGMGETREDRAGLLMTLANLPEHPKSVPINDLMVVPGTPLANTPRIDSFEFIRMIAVARLMMPTSFVRLSAGRERMNDEMQSLCFLAGANSIFIGDVLLTTPNPHESDDWRLLKKLGISALAVESDASISVC